MRRIFSSVAPTVVTGIAGLLVLISYVIPALVSWRIVLADIALTIAGVALLMGFVHLLAVHWQRFKQRKSVYSLILILVAVVVFIVLVSIAPPQPTALRASSWNVSLSRRHRLWAPCWQSFWPWPPFAWCGGAAGALSGS